MKSAKQNKALVQAIQFFIERYQNRQLGHRFSLMPWYVKLISFLVLFNFLAIATKAILLLSRGMLATSINLFVCLFFMVSLSVFSSVVFTKIFNGIRK